MYYYCEVKNRFRVTKSMELLANNDQEAIEEFKRRYGDRLEVIYAENFRILFPCEAE